MRVALDFVFVVFVFVDEDLLDELLLELFTVVERRDGAAVLRRDTDEVRRAALPAAAMESACTCAKESARSFA